VPPSCTDVLLAVIEFTALYSRRNDYVPISRPATDSQPGGLVECTGLSRNTVRKALALLEAWGCITRITPENVKGTKTPATLIALPIVPAPDELENGDGQHADEDVDEDVHHGQHDPGHQPVPMLIRSAWTDPGPVTLDSPGSRSPQTDPLREVSEKVLREQVQREAPRGRPPGGRSEVDRPAASTKESPPRTPTPPATDITEDDYRAAQDRMREALANGRGVDPADVRLVDEWNAQQRRSEMAGGAA